MDIEKLIYILNQVKLLSKHYEQIAVMSGENFNVFKILNVESSEVRLHSSMLAEFLNPKGSHGQGDVFLKAFVNLFNITDFDTKTAEAKVEVDIGTINDDYTEGGRIDILVVDGNGKKIIIENKIYATDQLNQLVRYYKYDNNAYLFYLNLYGNPPSTKSTGDLLKSDKFTVISYSDKIIAWLEQCKKEAVSLPVIRETIVQYINIIKQLTNQSTIQSMKEEIKKFLLDNPDYIEYVEHSNQALNAIIVETKNIFYEKVKKMMKLDLHSTFQLSGDLSLFIQINEDGDGVYIGYRLLKQGENYSNSAEAKKYIDILKSLHSEIRSSEWNIGWYNPEPFKRYMKFWSLGRTEIIKMRTNESYMNTITQQIADQELRIRTAFFDKIKNL